MKVSSAAIESRRSISTVTAAVAIVVIIVVAAGASALILLSPSTSSAPGSTSSFTPPPATSVSTSSAAPTTTSSSSASSTSAKVTPVNFMLDFTALGYHSLFYYGLDHGIYTQNGIGLTIMRGTGSAATVAAVSSGKVDFGLADTGTLIVSTATSNFSNVRIVSVAFPYTTFGIIYNKGLISKPSDLSGKTISANPGSGPKILFQIFAQLQGINYSSVKWTYASGALNNQLVALGKAEANVGGVDVIANIRDIAATNNIQLATFPYANYGMPLYGLEIITTTQMIANHPDTVSAFVKATITSILTAAKHPSDGIASLVKYNPDVAADKALGDYNIAVPLGIPNVNSTSFSSNPMSFGCVSPDRMQTTINMVAKVYNITSSSALSPSNIYTNQFVSC